MNVPDNLYGGSLDCTGGVEDVAAVSLAAAVVAVVDVVDGVDGVVAAAAVVVASCRVCWYGPVQPERECRCHQLPVRPSNTKCT